MPFFNGRRGIYQKFGITVGLQQSIWYGLFTIDRRGAEMLSAVIQGILNSFPIKVLSTEKLIVDEDSHWKFISGSAILDFLYQNHGFKPPSRDIL